MMDRFLRVRARRRDDKGAGTTILLVAIALVLSFASLMFFRITHLNDLRTRAQEGADAAALGALAPLREEAISLALSGVPPDLIGYWATGADATSAGRKYAVKNDSDLVGKVHQTSMLGYVAKADVASKHCDLKRESELTAQEKEDLRRRRNLCTDGSGKEGIGRKAGASAIAKFYPPSCTPVWAPGEGNADGTGSPLQMALNCKDSEGNEVRAAPNGNRRALARLFKLRLVAKEDPQKYTGQPYGLWNNGPLPDPGPLPPGTPEMIKRAIAFAMAQLGTWYQWGGSCTNASRAGATPANCDCSSLTQMSYRAAGIAIPRVTYDQVNYGRRIPPGQEKAGDLVFFHPGSRGPEHVGLVVDPAKGIMIEAPHTGAQVRTADYKSRAPIAFVRPYNEGRAT
ncbi:NlpC/P60 family protein [Actinomadura darangshiensis]|uniref:NlpC/P60 family protein n=1 Tax=Actinomadura darangshiensis TaxID=705336 RepID=A0A4R5B3S1_9ACTN|nr:C40 family peptidase [Actinomadura darangshiensis]TDD79603.1 NlpC/P60 family protein [Actinomadura darangshiensis]